MSKLTTKQKEFCNEYIGSGGAKDAAIKTGYSPKIAYSIGDENLNKPELKFYIKEQMRKFESKKTAGAREVLECLSPVIRGEQTEPVTTAKGVYDDVPVSAKDRISAAKKVLRRYPVDPLGEARLRRASAGARVAGAKAKAMEGNEQDIKQLLGKMLVSLDKADDRNSGN